MFNTKRDATTATSKGGSTAHGPNRNILSALLDQGTQFEGRLTFSGTVHINGKFAGEASGEDTLVILENGSVNGEIEVGTLEIFGEFVGQARARQKIVIAGTGRFRGEMDVPPGGLEIAPGGNFDGICRMGDAQAVDSRLTLAGSE